MTLSQNLWLEWPQSREDDDDDDVDDDDDDDNDDDDTLPVTGQNAAVLEFFIITK